jgi:uncharacterized membrane protein
VIVATVDSGVYKVLFLLHIVAIVAAFGPALLYPVLGRHRANKVAAETNQRISLPALVLAGLFGMGLLGASDKVYKFSQAWVSAALLVWILLIVDCAVLLRPALVAAADGDERAAARAGIFTGLLHLGLVVLLVLMIWKPGFHAAAVKP